MQHESFFLPRGHGRTIALARAAVVISVVGATFAAGSLLRAEDELREGLRGQYRDARGAVIQRVDSTMGFDWSDGRADSRLAGGALRVEWNGFLESEASGNYRVYAFGVGRFQVRLNDRIVLTGATSTPGWIDSEPIHLDYDQHTLQISYAVEDVPERIAFFWSGPGFQLEPLRREALHHDAASVRTGSFDRGKQLYEALRCAACHRLEGTSSGDPAPALDRLAGHIRRTWLIDWLQSNRTRPDLESEGVSRRMPYFAFDAGEVESLAEYLLATPNTRPASRTNASTEPDAAHQESLSLEAGKELFLTLGCVACHPWRDVGERFLFDGGDLTHIADKRPAAFFARWLSDPAAINRDHRMPIFDLDESERLQLARFLATPIRGAKPIVAPPSQSSDSTGAELAKPTEAVERGRQVFAKYRCGSCHRSPDAADNLKGTPVADPLIPLKSRRVETSHPAGTDGTEPSNPLTAKPDERLAVHGDGSDLPRRWETSCIGANGSKGMPRYDLVEADRVALLRYVDDVVAPGPGLPFKPNGRELAQQHNCFRCHDREQNRGLVSKIPQLIAAHPPLDAIASQIVPPSLNTVGDKFHDAALAAAIQRKGPVRRPWQRVRMPRFSLSKEELAAIVRYFRSSDRVPSRANDVDEPQASDLALRVAGGRLVASNGFGCVSCHAIGSVRPVRSDPGTRGPALDQLPQIVRRRWFDRIVHHPARIARRLEMPSVQTPVRGVLNNDMAAQMDALWYVLGLSNFDPPQPDPIRTVRHSGDPNGDWRVSVVTDVVRTPRSTYIKPLLIGFENRHSLAYDLESASMLRWSVGDVAYQRTEGKTWYWELAGEPLMQWSSDDPELTLAGNDDPRPVRQGQFFTELDAWSHQPNGVRFRHRLHFRNEASTEQTLYVQQEWTLWNKSNQHGVKRQLSVRGLRPGQAMTLRVVAASMIGRDVNLESPHELRVKDSTSSRIALVEPGQAKIADDGSVTIHAPRIADDSEEFPVQLTLLYASNVPIDRYEQLAQEPPPTKVVDLDLVPGYPMQRLPLRNQIMPTALAWQTDGTLLVASLKGKVWMGIDRDGDQLEDRLTPFSDELAAPFGLATGPDYVDVLTKFALLRLYDDNNDGRADRSENIASGWGHTDDYHDWAVGLPRDEEGNYFVALPCQQDNRDLAAAKFRGRTLKLVAMTPTPHNPRRFRLVEWSAGHRFPMGIALNRKGLLVVTDNQGNYNPFNELNHVVRGHHYGFINRLEQRPGANPPGDRPAVEIPHPWTRSVNGICFLEIDRAFDDRPESKSETFGPFEGHLIGCEYNSRRLIRMTLHEVDGQVQGAAYPFSRDAEEGEIEMSGPICCGVSPTGKIYIGSMRDSGWGGANNVGELLRMEFDPDRLACGIREVRAVADGFHVTFTRPVDRSLAAKRSLISISSYFRVSTPEYGGDDQQRRRERVERVDVDADAMGVTVRVDSLEVGRIYEIRLKPMVSEQTFFPAEAYYTLKAIPRD